MRMPSLGELAIILLIALIIFGPTKLPELGKALGRGIREFRGASKEMQKTLEEDESDDKEQDGSPN